MPSYSPEHAYAIREEHFKVCRYMTRYAVMETLANNFELQPNDLPINKEIMNLATLLTTNDKDDDDEFLKQIENYATLQTSMRLNTAVPELGITPDKFHKRHILGLEALREKKTPDAIGQAILDIYNDETLTFYADRAVYNLNMSSAHVANLSRTGLTDQINKAAIDAEFEVYRRSCDLPLFTEADTAA